MAGATDPHGRIIEFLNRPHAPYKAKWRLHEIYTSGDAIAFDTL
jgi:hypothetical protein